MEQFECKMCGYALKVNSNDSVTTCEHCGAQQTLPKLNDDSLENLHDITNHFLHNAKTSPLLERVFIFLEDGDWKSANEYCEKVLDIDPRNAFAYLGKLMAELNVKKQEILKNQADPFDSNSNYQKAVRFADENLKTTLAGYIAHINTRNENERLECAYNKAKVSMSVARSESAYKKAAKMFETIAHYKDAVSLAQQCLEKAEIARKEAERITKRNKKIAITTMTVACVIITLILIANFVIIPNNKYNDAIALMNAGKYEEAIAAFETLNDYKDSAEKIKECNNLILEGKYNDAIALMNAGKYEEAIAAFRTHGNYKDSSEKIKECNNLILEGKYNDAIALINAGKYEEAIAAFRTLGNYKDSSEKIKECQNEINEIKYTTAVEYLAEGNVVNAYEIFHELRNYKDSAEKAKSLHSIYTLKTAKVGGYIVLGEYEQDNNTNNGKEAVEWQVLEIRDNKALVISKKVLFCIQFQNQHWSYIPWKNSTARAYLTSFYDKSFTSKEKTMITESTLYNGSYYSNKNDDPTTQDHVFLLTAEEVRTYFPTDNLRVCRATQYAKANGTYSIYNDQCCWWTRTPSVLGDVVVINARGSIESSLPGTVESYGIRPAMWIDLSKVP